MEIAQIVKDFCCVCLKGRFDKEGNQISPPWDDPQDVVYTDENGNGYCLFSTLQQSINIKNLAQQKSSLLMSSVI